MKKLLTFLTSIVFLFLVASALYVLGLPPFSTIESPLEKPTQEVATLEEVPDFLSEAKIGRAKTYEEHVHRGELLEENGYHNLALVEYKAALDLDNSIATPLIEMGKINLRMGDYIKAKVNFEEALGKDPENIDIKIYLGRALLGDRKIAEAQKIFSTIGEDNQQSLYYKGIIAGFFGDYEGSKNLLRESLDEASNQDLKNKAYNFLQSYEEFNLYQGGVTDHLKAMLARSFTQTGEYQMAIPLLFEVLKDKKDYRDAWILLGYTYLKIEKYQDAIEALTEAKKLDSDTPETFFYLGLSYYGLNDLQKAVENLEAAKTKGYKQVIQINQKLAEIYLELKEYDKAAQSYEKVISLNSTDVNYFIRPIWIYLDRLQQPEKAVALAERALRAHPNKAMSFNLLGWATIGTGKLDEAENYLKKALIIDPNLDAVYLNYGVLNEKKGLTEKAIQAYQKAYQMGQGNSISSAAADHYNKLIGKTSNIDYATVKADLLNQ